MGVKNDENRFCTIADGGSGVWRDGGKGKNFFIFLNGRLNFFNGNLMDG